MKNLNEQIDESLNIDNTNNNEKITAENSLFNGLILGDKVKTTEAYTKMLPFPAFKGKVETKERYGMVGTKTSYVTVGVRRKNAKFIKTVGESWLEPDNGK